MQTLRAVIDFIIKNYMVDIMPIETDKVNFHKLTFIEISTQFCKVIFKIIIALFLPKFKRGDLSHNLFDRTQSDLISQEELSNPYKNCQCLCEEHPDLYPP